MYGIVLQKWIFAGVTAAVALAFAPQLSFGAGDPPKPSSDKCTEFRKGSPAWKRCMGVERQSDEDTYALGYWLAKTGDHAEALAVLRTAKDQSDPRVQTMTGFALRKLGRVDEAMAYYTAALAANPNLTSTRQYMGEAFLQQGATDKARDQLAEIGKRCGTSCEDYTTLAKAIGEHERKS